MTRKSVFFVAVFAVILACLCFVPAARSADLHERAKNLYDVGDYRAALNLYERILRDDPNDGLAWDISAWCLRYLGEAKSAAENYARALTLLKGEDAIWSFIGIGELYMDAERWEDALVKLREAHALAAGNEEAAGRAARDIEIAENFLARLKKNSSGTTAAAKPMTNAGKRLAEELLNVQPPAPRKADDVKLILEPDPGVKPKPEPSPDVKPKPKEDPAAKGKPKPETKPGAKPKPAQKPEAKPKPQTPPRPVKNDVIYGVKLGAPITETLEALKKQGRRVGEPFTKNGKEYYSVSDLNARLPEAITEGALRRRFYIAAYGGAVLSVNAELDYGKKPGFDALKQAAVDWVKQISGSSGTIGIRQSANIFSHEVSLAASNTYGVCVLVADKGNGGGRVEIQHIDLYGLSDYLSSEGRQ